MVVEPGFYQCVIKAHGYAQIKQPLILKKGKNVCSFKLEEQKVDEFDQGQEGVVSLHLFDAFSKEAIAGA